MTIPKQLRRFLHAEIDPAFSIRAEMIFREIARLRPATVLDMGCGRGFYTHSLSFFPFIKRIRGVDINKKYVQIARTHCTDKRIALHNASIYRLPFRDHTFDCIIFSEVLEHIGNEKRALNELRRVMKKNGTLLVTVPRKEFPLLWDPLNWFLMKFFNTHVNKDIWWLAGLWADHVRLYCKNEIVAVLEKNGFRVTSNPRPVLHWCWPFTHFLLYGIGKNILERLQIGQGLSRFSFTSRKPAAEFAAALLMLPARILDHKAPTNSSVNLFLTASPNSK